eukprot:CAMPEP_0197057810 /NCGR_PEP_ID=MMETSP1384-20130603/101085_1 /TAXON_ID=29189 /ORGANISM="Ammonia sp." /LENGTH=95 /DNA_ID=CAMNT_0042492355 /DNA_START=18 /DNA_END=305 /DNA_ORIENTATION=+
MGNEIHRSCCDVCSPFDRTEKRDRQLDHQLKKSSPKALTTTTTSKQEAADTEGSASLSTADSKSDEIESKDETNVSMEQWSSSSISQMKPPIVEP